MISSNTEISSINANPFTGNFCEMEQPYKLYISQYFTLVFFKDTDHANPGAERK